MLGELPHPKLDGKETFLGLECLYFYDGLTGDR